MSVPNEIDLYFHCATCLPEVPKGVSPAEWSSQQAGWTKDGMQVWCNRCDKSIIKISFREIYERYKEAEEE